MKPIQGDYVGTVYMHGSTKPYQIAITLVVDDAGPLTGSFRILDPGDGWTGPFSGDLIEGAWSQDGKVHLEENEDAAEKGYATFDGVFGGTDAASGVIWGAISVTKQRDVLTQTGSITVRCGLTPANRPFRVDDNESPWSN